MVALPTTNRLSTLPNHFIENSCFRHCFFRPAPSDLLRKELQAAYTNWAAHCRQHAKQLIEQQATRAPNDEPYHAMGDQLVQQGPMEAVYHPQIESALTRIRESVARIIAEKRRLGYTT